jgi:hypothetical protein
MLFLINTKTIQPHIPIILKNGSIPDFKNIFTCGDWTVLMFAIPRVFVAFREKYEFALGVVASNLYTISFWGVTVGVWVVFIYNAILCL